MADRPLPAGLSARMALSAHGFGAVIDGILDIRTVTESPKNSAILAFSAKGCSVVVFCQNPDCDCLVRDLKRFRPDINIVPVNVQARDA